MLLVWAGNAAAVNPSVPTDVLCAVAEVNSAAANGGIAVAVNAAAVSGVVVNIYWWWRGAVYENGALRTLYGKAARDRRQTHVAVASRVGFADTVAAMGEMHGVLIVIAALGKAACQT